MNQEAISKAAQHSQQAASLTERAAQCAASLMDLESPAQYRRQARQQLEQVSDTASEATRIILQGCPERYPYEPVDAPLLRRAGAQLASLHRAVAHTMSPNLPVSLDDLLDAELDLAKALQASVEYLAERQEQQLLDRASRIQSQNAIEAMERLRAHARGEVSQLKVRRILDRHEPTDVPATTDAVRAYARKIAAQIGQYGDTTNGADTACTAATGGQLP